jgi:hypothetical protein
VTERYEERFSDIRLPGEEQKRMEWAETIGSDGRRLLERVFAENHLPRLQGLDAGETLRYVWAQHSYARSRMRSGERMEPAAVAQKAPPGGLQGPFYADL